MNDPNDVNPYAPPVPVEEEIRHDLRKIVRCHSRINAFICCWLFLLGLELLIAFVLLIVFGAYLHHEFLPDRYIVPVLFIVFFALTVFSCYGIFLAAVAVWMMKCKADTFFFVILGTMIPMVNIIVCLMINLQIREILRDAGMETAGRKIDLAQFRREEDY